MFRYLPEQASNHAPNVDWLHHLITDLSIFFTVAIVGVMIYFAVKYRKRNGVDHETPQIEGDLSLEIIWTVVPTIICIIIGYYGIIYYKDMRTVPSNAMTINVTGQKWSWDFEYENGKKTYGEFVIPVDKPVKLLLQSRDVLHSFFIPSMRVKSDVVPGSYTYVSFTPVKTGLYQSYCTEYCGDNHYSMLANLRVVSQAEFDAWLVDRSEEILAERMDPAELGAKLYVQKTCSTCHSLDGSPKVGPSFLKLYGAERKFTDGTTRTADEEYIRQSIYQPNSQVVEGYPPAMSQFIPAQVPDSLAAVVTDKEALQLIAFIKTLDGTQEVEVEEVEPVAASEVDKASMTTEERGEWIYQNKMCVTCHSLDGSRIVGPSFKGIYGKSGKLADGSDYLADDAYLKESILKPNDKVVEGYAPAMPAQQFSDDEVADIIAYLKTLK